MRALLIFAGVVGVVFGQAPTGSVPVQAYKEEAPVVTQHSIQLNGKTLKYVARAGMLPIRNNGGEVEAGLFYVDYVVEGEKNRPLCIAFNGGPGAGTLWLHLGAIGPRRIKMKDDGAMPPAPYQLEDNQGTWLDVCDLVFVDPVGTGFSRATKTETARKYNGFTGDIESVGEFIRLYLARNQRFSSPLFIAGESYGTTRAAGLAGALTAKGYALNGVILISSILNFQTARFTKGNDLPYALFLPTYAATAWYHKKVDAAYQKDLPGMLKAVRTFAEGEYTVALMKGDRLAAAEKDAIATKLMKFTGLSKEFLLRNDLRIEIQRFTKELRRSEGIVVGRLDSRLTGTDGDNGAASPEFDPSAAAILPPYTHAMNQYAREELKYQTDAVYFALGGGILPWDYSNAQNQFADTSDSLRAAFDRNPYMKVMVANGYYDLATPFFATEYTFSHMKLKPEQSRNVTMKEYESGHMMYIHVPSLVKLKEDVGEFVRGAKQ
ncbi:MAG: S10 family peptidase [Acidobacteriota bacterium]|jgi:carboxypeptidase C (cathepsin A)